MIVITIILFVIVFVYSITILLSVLGFINLKKSKVKNTDKEVKISLIIAFRNEEDVIQNCLQSIVKQKYSLENYEVILVNDHSDDESVPIVKVFTEAYSNFSLLHLKEGESKKAALKLGVSKAKYDFIAFTDADCHLPEKWFFNLSNQIDDNDMLVGPVVMNSTNNSFNDAFQRLDFMAIQGNSFGLLNYKKPILNNAANLLIRKEAFYQVGGYDNYNTPSGDDVFLLEKFLKHNMNIKGCLIQQAVVNTKTENSWKQFIHQRLRWASKAKYYKNPWLNYIGILILSVNVAVLFIYGAIVLVENYRLTLLFFLLSKWLIDFILLFLVASFFNRKRDLFYFIPVQLIYPVYVIGIGLLSLFGSYKWKGRKI